MRHCKRRTTQGGACHVSAIDLKEHYLNYIATVNERRFEDLPTFVADELVYNDERMTGRQYRELLEYDASPRSGPCWTSQH